MSRSWRSSGSGSRKDERDEHETLLDVYLRAMESPEPAPIAEAA
jgi:hypothetical protein